MHGELLVLGVKVAASTVWEILHDAGIDLWVPRISSTSCDQAVFVDHAADARVSSDTVLLKIGRFG